MPINRVSATLPQADLDAILAAVQTMRDKLPFTTELTIDERKAMPKLGDKSRAFVKKTLELAVQNPGVLPRDFDIEEMRKDVLLFEAMYAIQQSLTKVKESVDDTVTAVGSEAYVAALLVYNYAKSSGVGTAGLDAVIDELGQRFARKSKVTVKAPA
jgi:hypothetical protein